jgi:hypothetical protein
VYLLTVHNRSQQPVRDVVLECRLGPELVFPGTRDKLALQKLGDLAPGEAKETALTLVSDRLGRHCCEFTVRAGGIETEWKQVCVNFVEKQLAVSLLGPAERSLRSRAEFNLKIVNTTPRPLDDVEAVLFHPAELEAKEATEGARQQPGELAWKIGRLKPGEGVQLQAEFECVKLAERVCARAEVTGRNLPVEEAESCLEIAPAEARLQLRVLDRADPIDVGDETAFVTLVENHGARPVRQLQLRAEIPESLRVVSAEVAADERRIYCPHAVTGTEVVFDPVPSLAPKSHLRFLIQVQALRPGDAEFQARLKSSLGDDAMTSSEPLTIRPGD